MASNRQIYKVEELAESSTIQATYQTKATLTFTPDANSTYLIISSAIVMNDDASSSVKFRLYDNTGSNVLSEQIYMPKDITDYISAGAAATQSFGASPSSQTYYAQYCTTGLAGPVSYIAQARIIAIKLTSEDRYNSSTGRSTYNGGTSYQTKVATVFTPTVAGDYLGILSCVIDGSSTSYDSRSRIVANDSISYAFGTTAIEAVNAANRVGCLYFHKYTFPTTAPATVGIYYGTESTSNTVGIAYAWITALRLDEFFNNFEYKMDTEKSISGALTAVGTLDTSAASATTHIFLGSGLQLSKSTSNSVYSQFRRGTEDILTATLEMKDTANYHPWFGISYDTSPATKYELRVGGEGTGYAYGSRMYLLQAAQAYSTSYATITQNIQYNVSKPYSLSENSTYCVPSVKSTYLDSNYRVGKGYSQSQNISYKVSKGHEQTQNIVYTVPSTHSIYQNITYNVLKTYSTSLNSTYNVIVTTLHTISHDARYSVQSTGSKSQTISYTVQRTNSTSQTASYNVSKTQSVSQNCSYRIGTLHQDSKTGSYKVLSYPSKTLTSSYCVLNIHTINQVISYKVGKSYSQSLNTEYDVQYSTTNTLSRNAWYVVQTTQSLSFDADYFITGEGEPHTISQTTQYAVSATSSIYRNIQYAVSKSQSTLQTIHYEIGTPQSKTQTIQYKVGSSQSKTLTAQYIVSSVNSKTEQVQYKVLSTHSTSLNCVYTISRTISRDCTYSVSSSGFVYNVAWYCVPSENTVLMTCEYSNGKREEITVSMNCQYTIPSTYIESRIIETRVKSQGVVHKFKSRVSTRVL